MFKYYLVTCEIQSKYKSHCTHIVISWNFNTLSWFFHSCYVCNCHSLIILFWHCWKSYLTQGMFFFFLPFCEAWSFTLREEQRLRVFENKILRRIFEPKGDSNGEWKRLHNEELHSLYRSPNIVRVIKSRRLGWA